MNEQTPNGKNKTYGYIVLAIVVIALIAWAIYASNHRTDNTSNNTTTQNQDQTSMEASTTPTSTPVTTGAPSKKLSYGDAIKAYPYRFQFSSCHATPGTIAVRKSSVVMLDNRDAVAHTIKADNQTFKIAGYDYALLDASVLTTPTVNVTCDGGGAGILNVEK